MDTKKTKRRIDDETVDRLVENRPVRHTPKKKKKKKKRGLSALAVLLSAMLIFVIFFVGSYIFFTASSPSDEPDITPVAPTYKEVNEEDSLVVESENEEIEENEEGEFILERPDASKQSDNHTITEDKTEKKEDTKKEDKKKETEDEPKADSQPSQTKPENSIKDSEPTNEVVEKNEESEAIVIE